MKYFKLMHDDDPKIVGSDYPFTQFTKEYEKIENDPNAYFPLINKLLYENIMPDYNPDLSGYVLSYRAKKMDIIQENNEFLLFSEKAREIVEQECNLGYHKFFESTVYVKKQPIKYYFLATRADVNDKIAWKEMLYWANYNYDQIFFPVKGTLDNDTTGIINIRECLGLDVEISSNLGLKPLEIKFKNNMDLDFITINRPPFRYIVSQHFIDVIEAHKLTGLAFEETDLGRKAIEICELNVITIDEAIDAFRKYFTKCR